MRHVVTAVRGRGSNPTVPRDPSFDFAGRKLLFHAGYDDGADTGHEEALLAQLPLPGEIALDVPVRALFTGGILSIQNLGISSNGKRAFLFLTNPARAAMIDLDTDDTRYFSDPAANETVPLGVANDGTLIYASSGGQTEEASLRVLRPNGDIRIVRTTPMPVADALGFSGDGRYVLAESSEGSGEYLVLNVEAMSVKRRISVPHLGRGIEEQAAALSDDGRFVLLHLKYNTGEDDLADIIVTDVESGESQTVVHGALSSSTIVRQNPVFPGAVSVGPPAVAAFVP